MANIIIPASKSLTVTSRFPFRGINENTIKIGHDRLYNYISYLSFDISSIPPNITVSKAELVLFKTDNFIDNKNIRYHIYPLNDYFSPFTNYNRRPSINRDIKKEFYPMTSKAAVTVDVTEFVSLWIKDKLPTTGIALLNDNSTHYANCCSSYAKFGSSMCPNSSLVPFIRIVFTPNICPEKPTIRQIYVTGEIGPESKYEAVIEAKVTRNSSNNIDNYYVTDEYDNSSSNKPLPIDKTYCIVINPRESEGDIEEINFYGSYKNR